MMVEGIAPQSRFVEVAGVRTHYLRAGSGPPLLLLHGLVSSARIWDSLIQGLAEHATVCAPDLSNMGLSGRVPGLDPSLEAEADRVAAFMGALGLAQANLAGHSHGGALAMMIASRHPEKVGRLVLFAPANPYCRQSRILLSFYNSRLGSWFARQIPRLPRKIHDVAHRRMYVDRSKVTQSALASYNSALNSASIDHILGITGAWWADMAKLHAHLPELAGRSLLLIWGDRDPAVCVASGQRLAEVLGAKLLVMPGVGHLPFAEQPELCIRAMREWLA